MNLSLSVGRRASYQENKKILSSALLIPVSVRGPSSSSSCCCLLVPASLSPPLELTGLDSDDDGYFHYGCFDYVAE
jgi:hypothetical protein